MPRFALAAVLIVSLACASDEGRVDIGLPVPAYATTTLTGDSITLASQRDKVVMLNVWATWCQPCRTEIPELLALYEKYRDRGFTVVGVTVDAEGSEEVIKSFIDEFKMTFPVWHDASERVLNQFLAIGVPSTFLIDRQGILQWRKLGPVTPNDSVSRIIERLLP